jgi:hypothetical protein
LQRRARALQSPGCPFLPTGDSRRGAPTFPGVSTFVSRRILHWRHCSTSSRASSGVPLSRAFARRSPPQPPSRIARQTTKSTRALSSGGDRHPDIAAGRNFAIQLIALVFCKNMTAENTHASTQGWRAIATRCFNQHAPITIINADSMTHDIPMRGLGRRSSYRDLEYGEHGANNQTRESSHQFPRFLFVTRPP